MTPENNRASQGVTGVTPMIFERTGLQQLESSEGYRVNVVKVGGVWVYHAQGPKRETVRNGRVVQAVIDPIKGRIDAKVTYAIGDEMPFPREDLGTWRADKFAKPEDARDAAITACNQHHQLVLQQAQNAAENIAGPPGISATRVRSSAEKG